MKRKLKNIQQLKWTNSAKRNKTETEQFGKKGN